MNCLSQVCLKFTEPPSRDALDSCLRLYYIPLKIARNCHEYSINCGVIIWKSLYDFGNSKKALYDPLYTKVQRHKQGLSGSCAAYVMWTNFYCNIHNFYVETISNFMSWSTCQYLKNWTATMQSECCGGKIIDFEWVYTIIQSSNRSSKKKVNFNYSHTIPTVGSTVKSVNCKWILNLIFQRSPQTNWK